MNIHAYIDHTCLRADSTLEDIGKLCGEAMAFHFAAVCVPPLYTKMARQLLTASGVKTATVIGFPLGYEAIEAKLAEVVLALVDGAEELDMVINIAAVKNKDWGFLNQEISTIFPLVQKKNALLKVIIESGILTREEIIKCCEIYGGHGVDFLKTSTGFASSGASVEAVGLMKSHLPSKTAIKASGGIRTIDFARDLIDAGATRLGCSNAPSFLEKI
ncbi:MAG: deoxyribose-phosphate aldolase [Chitinophagaceae bacterium]